MCITVLPGGAMLGNVKPYMPALSDTGKAKYTAYYCGLCKALGRGHGLFSRFMLNYDMAFVAVLHSEMNNVPYATSHSGCLTNPFKKKDILLPCESTDFAADVLIMLTFFKARDNMADEKFIKKAGWFFLYPYLYLKYRHAAAKHPALANVLRQESSAQQALEAGSDDIDRLAMPTANMVRAIMLECAGCENRFAAGQFGFLLGRVIYLLDALCDRKEDETEKRFNIFNIKGFTDEESKAECFMALGELAHRYSRLNIKENKEITDNIIYLSLARQIKFADENQKDEVLNGQ